MKRLMPGVTYTARVQVRLLEAARAPCALSPARARARARAPAAHPAHPARHRPSTAWARGRSRRPWCSPPRPRCPPPPRPPSRSTAPRTRWCSRGRPSPATAPTCRATLWRWTTAQRAASGLWATRWIPPSRWRACAAGWPTCSGCARRTPRGAGSGARCARRAPRPRRRCRWRRPRRWRPRTPPSPWPGGRPSTTGAAPWCGTRWRRSPSAPPPSRSSPTSGCWSTTAQTPPAPWAACARGAHTARACERSTPRAPAPAATPPTSAPRPPAPSRPARQRPRRGTQTPWRWPGRPARTTAARPSWFTGWRGASWGAWRSCRRGRRGGARRPPSRASSPGTRGSTAAPRCASWRRARATSSGWRPPTGRAPRPGRGQSSWRPSPGCPSRPTAPPSPRARRPARCASPGPGPTARARP